MHTHSLEILFIGFALLLPAGCAGTDSARQSSQQTVVNASSSQRQGFDRCALLKDNEVEGVIGPHHPGNSDLNNMWGLQSCRWVATTAQQVDAYPNGWFDAIEVAVFDQEKESWARKEAKGKPLNGFVDGALYDESYGDLWFSCAHDRFCVVKVRTASGKNREQFAQRLSELVENRLR